MTLCTSVFARPCSATHPLGRPDWWHPDTIDAIDRDHVAGHYREHYVGPGLVFTAAGSLDHDLLCRIIVDELSRDGVQLGAGR